EAPKAQPLLAWFPTSSAEQAQFSRDILPRLCASPDCICQNRDNNLLRTWVDLPSLAQGPVLAVSPNSLSRGQKAGLRLSWGADAGAMGAHLISLNLPKGLAVAAQSPGGQAKGNALEWRTSPADIQGLSTRFLLQKTE